jgi:integrase
VGVTVREKENGSGVWWVFIRHGTKRKSKRVGDRQTAAEVAKKIAAKLVLGDLKLDTVEKAIPTFGEYAKTWIGITVPATCKTISVSDYKGMLKNHILPVFSKTPVTEITKLAVKKFLMEKSKDGYAASSITHIKNAVSGVLNLAIDDEVIKINPAQKLGKIVREKGLKLQIDPLTNEATAVLLDAFKKHYLRHYPMALTLCRTGMRLGEVIGLQWMDVDFHGCFLTVQRGRSKSRTETPKNGKSRRVDMSKQLAETLSQLKRQRLEEKLREGWKEMPPWVFITEKGTPLIEGHWRERVFYKALEKAKLRKIRIHDLRHGYATQLIQAGESLVYIKDQLGHSSIKVTVDIYGHLVPGANRSAVDRLDDEAPNGTLLAPNTEKELVVNG